MDPSYNNNGMGNAAAGGNSDTNNVPGVKPGVVASGPVAPSAPVTPAAPTMPATPVTPADANAAKVSSVFGYKPTINTTPPVSPASDIILQPMSLGDSSKKPKKGLIIGGLVAIVLLIVGLVVGLLAMNGGNGGSNNTIAGHSDFLKYANYLLNGTESTNSDLGTFDEEKDYAVTTAYIEDNKGFFNKAWELWKVFYDKIMDDENSSVPDDMVGDIEYQNELMDYIVKYMNTQIWDEDDLLQLYIANGLDGAKTKVDENYKDLLDTLYWSGQRDTKVLVDYAKRMLGIYAAYDSFGCIINKDIDDVCEETNAVAISAAQREYLDGIPDIDDEFIIYLVDELEEYCFMINGDIEGIK